MSDDSKSPKRAADDDAKDAPVASPAKKQKKGAADKAEAGPEEYSLNVNKALDKEHEASSFSEIIKLPPSALEGLADRADKMLAAFNIKTIEDLANWKYFKIARAIVVLSKEEQKGKRDPKSKQNMNKAVDKEWEKKSFHDIVRAPVSALQGLAPWADDTLAPLRVKTIGQLASWKFLMWAEALVVLAANENADFSSA